MRVQPFVDLVVQVLQALIAVLPVERFEATGALAVSDRFALPLVMLLAGIFAEGFDLLHRGAGFLFGQLFDERDRIVGCRLRRLGGVNLRRMRLMWRMWLMRRMGLMRRWMHSRRVMRRRAMLRRMHA